MTVSSYLNDELVDYASYSTLRAIGSLVDGQKNAARKVIHTVKTKVKNDTKVEILGGIVAVNTQYLHGPQTLGGVIVNLAQDFPGTNNIPLLIREGIFGSRFSHEASASRYIFTNKESHFDKIFKPEDDKVLLEQVFEGDVIEPRFFVPTVPLLLINGSEGIATGFAQKILSRNPKSVIAYIQKYLKNKQFTEEKDGHSNGTVVLPDGKLLDPWFKGFEGTIIQGVTPNQWLIKGKFEKVSLTKLKITEIPVHYDLATYTEVLDDLEDSKAIRGYKDLSDDDKFLFEVDVESKFLKQDEEAILSALGLVKKVSENFTCINEKNRVSEYTSPVEIIHHYLDIKLEYMQLRKEATIQEMKDELAVLKSKYFFIKGVLDETIIVNKKTKAEIIEQLKNTQYIIEVDGSYDYLTNMAIHNLSNESFQKLVDALKKKKAILDEYSTKTIYQIYNEELEELNTFL